MRLSWLGAYGDAPDQPWAQGGQQLIEKDITDVLDKPEEAAVVKITPVAEIRARPDVIFDLVRNKCVLHLGCTDHLHVIDDKIKDGVYLHQNLSGVASECLGIDINKETIEYLNKLGITNVILADITQPGIRQISEKHWDCLLMAEVLEHIDDPVSFLKDIALNYRENIDTVIITVPNVFGLNHVSNAITHGIEAVNSDHRYWFTPYTLCKVVHEAGWILDDLIMCMYEYSMGAMEPHYDMLISKPVLMDTIVLVASMKNPHSTINPLNLKEWHG